MAKILIDTEKLQELLEANAEMIVWNYTNAQDNCKSKMSLPRNIWMIILPIWNAPFKNFKMDFSKNKESIQKFTNFVIEKIKTK